MTQIWQKSNKNRPTVGTKDAITAKIQAKTKPEAVEILVGQSSVFVLWKFRTDIWLGHSQTKRLFKRMFVNLVFQLIFLCNDKEKPLAPRVVCFQKVATHACHNSNDHYSQELKKKIMLMKLYDQETGHLFVGAVWQRCALFQHSCC